MERPELTPVIVQDAATDRVLMLAWMDAEALRRTRESGEAWFWSRSRQEYWRKGATSGNTMAVEDVVFCAMVGDGVFGADDLTAQHLGEGDEVGVATGHDGITLRDALLLRNVMSACVSDRMLSLENLRGSPGDPPEEHPGESPREHSTCGWVGVGTSPRSES